MPVNKGKSPAQRTPHRIRFDVDVAGQRVHEQVTGDLGLEFPQSIISVLHRHGRNQ